MSARTTTTGECGSRQVPSAAPGATTSARARNPCEHICLDLHDGTYECSCFYGFALAVDGYSCARLPQALSATVTTTTTPKTTASPTTTAPSSERHLDSGSVVPQPEVAADERAVVETGAVPVGDVDSAAGDDRSRDLGADSDDIQKRRRKSARAEAAGGAFEESAGVVSDEAETKASPWSKPRPRRHQAAEGDKGKCCSFACRRVDAAAASVYLSGTMQSLYRRSQCIFGSPV